MINIPNGTLNNKNLISKEVKRSECGDYFITFCDLTMCRDCEIDDEMNANGD